MANIFLSYRRDDSAGFAGRLADALEAAFGVGSVFRDVDDIRAGEDFGSAIRAHLDAVSAVLVLIGPRWLSAALDGQRRLDDADDFVRREIEAALASGKPVVPLLMSGAAMPTEAELPASIVGLARRQAVVLSDAGWRDDVARLVDSLRPLLPARAAVAPGRRRMLLGLAGAVFGSLPFAWLIHAWRQLVPTATVAEKAQEAPAAALSAVTGRWTARVKYDWGDEHDEVFEFKDMGGELRGTASYLTGRLAIEAAKLTDGWLRFVTRSQEMMGSDNPWKEAQHHYTGQVTPEGILFTLETRGGYSVHPPVDFVARRQGRLATQ